jgi:hypothetical protein
MAELKMVSKSCMAQCSLWEIKILRGLGIGGLSVNLHAAKFPEYSVKFASAISVTFNSDKVK